jgi:SAM-dependent methyltransferase
MTQATMVTDRPERSGLVGKLLVGSSPLNIVPQVLWEVRGRRVLDVGCGCGVYGYLLRNKWQETQSGNVQFRSFADRDPANDEPELLAGIDIHVENVLRCAKHNVYDFLALGRAENLPFPENYVDTILCVEVLEHLPKADALRAICDFERIARERIVITVPRLALDPSSKRDEREFLKIDTEDPIVREWVEAERHKCEITSAELRNLGFRIGRELHSGWRRPVRRLKRLWENARTGQILAVKDLRQGADSRRTDVPPPPRWTGEIADYR